MLGIAQMLSTMSETVGTGTAARTYREYMHRRLHDDIEKLPLPCLRIDSAIVTPFDAEDDLQHVGD